VEVKSLEDLGDRLLVIFDGRCGLCNRSVRWLLRRDRRDRLCFVASQSEKVAELLARYGFGAPDSASAPSTILVVRGFGDPTEQVLVRSEAVLVLLRALPQPWPLVAAVIGWIPRPVRDLGYRLIARGRRRFGGRRESCPVPGPRSRHGII
jgi:predicted DCC family thiol-disulfide oxidoreductase YuxK